MSDLRQDLRYALRSLAKAPGFTLATLSVLTVGIGGTTAVFSVLHGILLHPLPYTEPDRLAVAWTINTQQGLPDGTSQLNARDWLERGETIEDIALFIRPEFTTATITQVDLPERIHVGVVTSNFFSVLGVQPVIGRTFRADDIHDSQLAVLSESYWQQQYGASPDVIGSTIEVDGEPMQIVGVVPSSVQIPRAETRIWQLHDPFAERMPSNRRFDAYVVLARLRPDVPMEAAQSELSQIAAQLAVEFPETNRYFGVQLRPLLTEITGERLPFVLWTLFGAVVIVLIVAATNVAHMMLARGARRYREVAIRAALGASQFRIVRQLSIESGVIGVLAVLGGVAFGAIALRLMSSLLPQDIPRLDQVGLNGSVLILAVVVTVLIAPLFALLPSFMISRHDPARELQRGGRGASGRYRRLRRVLVIAQVAMAVILLAEAGLLIRSVRAVNALHPGFDARSLLIAQVDLSRASYEDGSAVRAFVELLLPRLRALPGVRDAAVIDDFFIRRFPDIRINVEGGATPAVGENAPRLTSDGVSPGFFDAIGMPILAGRELEQADFSATNRPQVVVINQSMAEAFWPGESPIDRRFWWSDQNPDEHPGITVVGVVPDMRRGRLEDAPYPQLFGAAPSPSMDLVIRTDGNPLAVTEAVRRTVADLDPNVPLSRVGTAWSQFDDSMAQRRMQSWLLGAFSAMAILLSAVGLYALLYDAVTTRRREIGIRIALGAAPTAVRRLVLQEGALLAGVGLVIGAVGATVVSRLTESMFFGVAAGDPGTLAAVSVVLMGVALFASWIPARRATRVQPIETLSGE